jgi:hypothetical protein
MRLPGLRWHRPCEAVIVFRMWMATLYAVEITRGQNFGEPHVNGLYWSIEGASVGLLLRGGARAESWEMRESPPF